MVPDAVGNQVLAGTAGQFATTHWSVVLAASGGNCPQAAQALERLCRSYWYPLYAYVRRSGYTPEDAQDLTQAFFARLLAKGCLGTVDRAKGRFRSFLLATLKHFLANEWDRAHRQKRGGGTPLISLEGAEAERRYVGEQVSRLSPDTLYEQRWACVLLERVMERLTQEYESGGKGVLFEALRPFLAGEKHSLTYAALALEFGLSEAALKMKVQRMRHRYQALLRQEIASTVGSPEEVEDEIQFLFRVVSR
jgi:DNA-directed RNA polymerase specialized sigma24 family protein